MTASPLEVRYTYGTNVEIINLWTSRTVTSSGTINREQVELFTVFGEGFAAMSK
jgi:hypothetical protein